jgi:dimethylargininase
MGLTTSNLGKPDYYRMKIQHEAYVDKLRELKLAVTVLEAEPGFPDAHFVEDTAVVTPVVAVITNPGAPARQGEEKRIETVLAAWRPTLRIDPPGTVDGGDVLMMGTHFFIGRSARTNKEGAEQLCRILEDFGNTCCCVDVGEGLHLKSKVNAVGPDTLLLTRDLKHLPVFDAYDKIVLHPEETYAGNTLLINGHLIIPEGFPKTKKQLEALGCPVHVLDMSEVQKMDGGLTCLSLRF